SLSVEKRNPLKSSTVIEQTFRRLMTRQAPPGLSMCFSLLILSLPLPDVSMDTSSARLAGDFPSCVCMGFRGGEWDSGLSGVEQRQMRRVQIRAPKRRFGPPARSTLSRMSTSWGSSCLQTRTSSQMKVYSSSSMEDFSGMDANVSGEGAAAEGVLSVQQDANVSSEGAAAGEAPGEGERVQSVQQDANVSGEGAAAEGVLSVQQDANV
ncbi:unnamed protein product, partial [Ectocarpus sp. 6 AP-2014]